MAGYRVQSNCVSIAKLLANGLITMWLRCGYTPSNPLHSSSN